MLLLTLTHMRASPWRCCCESPTTKLRGPTSACAAAQIPPHPPRLATSTPRFQIRSQSHRRAARRPPCRASACSDYGRMLSRTTHLDRYDALSGAGMRQKSVISHQSRFLYRYGNDQFFVFPPHSPFGVTSIARHRTTAPWLHTTPDDSARFRLAI